MREDCSMMDGKDVSVLMLHDKRGNMEVERDGIGSKMTSDRETDERRPQRTIALHYGIDDNPPWYICLLLAIQHNLTSLSGMIIIPLFVAKTVCLEGDWVTTSQVFSTALFVCGVTTLMQSTVGSRLPVIQGAAVTFLLPAMSLFSVDEWKCSTPNMTGLNSDVYNTSDTSAAAVDDDSGAIDAPWQRRMRELQGAVILASLGEVVLGTTGLVGLLVRYIGPLTIAPVITMIALPMVDVAASYAQHNWWIAFLTIVLIALFSQYIDWVEIPVCMRKDGRWKKGGYRLFQSFPVMLAVTIVWLICGVLTATDAIPNDRGHWAYNTRTDTKAFVLRASPWFQLPYPFQWGFPTFSLPGFVALTSGVLASTIESVGDYYACARLSGAPVPPTHAINRGIATEGVGCVLAGVFGSGILMTSFSTNIAIIAVTKVASRRVVIYSAVIMLVMGVFGKFSALFVSLPEPIVGGVFAVMFGIIAAVGVSNLQFVDMSSTRNLFVFGVSIILGSMIPNWLYQHPGAINTGVQLLDQTITVLSKTHMFVAGLTALLLDNSIPGSDEERGLIVWHQTTDSDDDATKVAMTTYDVPLITPLMRRSSRWTRYIPLCSTFNGFQCGAKCRRSSTPPDSATDVQKSRDEEEISARNESPYIHVV